MVQARNEFTNVTTLRSEAIGEPGSRTFRVLVDSESSSAIIWLEKEQLFQLALAVQQLLIAVGEEEPASSRPPSDREAPGLTKLDFKAVRLVLGHDEERSLFLIDAHDQEDEDEEQATVRVWADRERVKGFAEEALRLCAAGRPLCPLCGRPMDATGHLCARRNGHARITEA